MSSQKAFVVYKDWSKMIDKLSDQDAGQLFKALFDFVNDGTISDLPLAADIAFTFMQGQLERDAEKYERTCERRAEAGRKSGEVRRLKAEQKRTKRTSVDFVEQSPTKRTDTNTDTDTDTDTDTNTDTDNIYIREKQPEKKPAKRFVPPTVDEVAAYCAERHNGIDAEHFVDHYTSNGWLVGKNKMKDWKAAVRTWERNSVKVVPQQTVKKGRNDWIDDVEL